MARKRIILFAILFIFAGTGFFWLFSRQNLNRNAKEIIIKEKKFQVEIASSQADRKIGLSGRKNLCENCGMLFIFEKPGQYSFWMKDMQFSLDIIWILGNEVVYLACDIPANLRESIHPSVFSDKVLEINGGIANKLDLKIGDEVNF